MVRKVVALLGLTLLLIGGTGLAFAQEDEAPPPQAWGLTVGYMVGDLASELVQDGFQAELDDEMTVGLFYLVDLNERVSFETRLSVSPGTMLNTENGDVSTTVIFLDFTLIPKINIGSFELGIPMGLGWAATQEDDAFLNQVYGRASGIKQDGGSGATYYLGLRKDFKLGEKWNAFVDLRARRFHRLVNIRERTVKTTELAIGFARNF
ncbi:MAG: outer membrane beta-barrel protein [Acidobacteriota bacterium]|nr:outer membrane beta-barrel protein [Acidobacteriota bacterium]MDQ7086469.1 outer membrane beta-barrel protein [Acidobacteriota bacterium]